MATGRPTGSATVEATVRALLEDVRDPEIPVLTLADLGVLRDVAVEGGRVTVTITPTYSGCPAMHTMEQDVRRVLAEAGYRDVVVKTRLAPAWTTDWLTPTAHAKLRSVGIAPPVNVTTDKRVLLGEDVPCPRCASRRTEKVSEFGSTACKALYRCRDCLEPFDYFKCL
ncbi:MAG: 1,2-phenylacetyl-CoA epoxidase subunit PaaD [Gammaproteobacteria bacterium]